MLRTPTPDMRAVLRAQHNALAALAAERITVVGRRSVEWLWDGLGELRVVCGALGLQELEAEVQVLLGAKDVRRSQLRELCRKVGGEVGREDAGSTPGV